MSTTDVARAFDDNDIEQYLASRDGMQMVQLMRKITSPAAQAALTEWLLSKPRAAVGVTKVAANAGMDKKPLKALNAFVGFRCYYISMTALEAWPMKKLSKPMSTLWKAEVNKPLWSLLAKAWSAIRDQIEKDNAPLDKFFDIICPFVGITAPDNYLRHTGWELGINEDGLPTARRAFEVPPELLDLSAVAMAISVEEIIRYVKGQGYAHEFEYSASANPTTFLSKAKGKGKQLSLSPQPVMSKEEAQVAVLNMKRAQREEARYSSRMADLRTEHAALTGDKPVHPTRPIDNANAGSLNALHDFVAGGIAQKEENNAPVFGSTPTQINPHHNINSLFSAGPSSVSRKASTDDATQSPGHTDAAAFRSGADSNITLTGCSQKL